MKVGLIHNANAGDAVSADELARLIARHGHDVVAVTGPGDGVDHWHLDGLDVVAAAGGDGTIATAARALAGTSVPMGVVPMGTANNVALSLGVPMLPDEAIEAWRTSTARPLDLGVATGPWGERRFVESVGGGLVTHGTVVMDRRSISGPTTAAQIALARHAHADVLARLDPAEWHLEIDGRAFTGSYLLLEVLNIGAVGPNLILAPDASPWDGRFTVVAAAVDQRDDLIACLRDDTGNRRPGSLAVWHGRELVLTAGDRLHVDDEVVEPPAPPGVRIRLEAGALQVLVPRR